MQELTAHNKIVYNYQNYKSDTCKILGAREKVDKCKKRSFLNLFCGR